MSAVAVEEPVVAAPERLRMALSDAALDVPGLPDVQAQAEAMIDRHGFLGVQRWNFAAGGRERFGLLREAGLRPDSKLLDIGCGCLRVAAWVVLFLDPGHYCGIEPARERVAYGREFLFDAATWQHRAPRFDHNAVFDTDVFGERFDFFFACSIWTHASKPQIATMLDGFLRNTVPSAKFLVSYFPAATADDDYQGTTWVGTSHESTKPGIVRHRLDWIRAECARRGLAVGELPGVDVDDQLWLVIRHAAADEVQA